MDTLKIGDNVLYKNNQLIAFNKPPGIPVQSDKTGDTSLLVLAQAYTRKNLELIHRIDRPASGVVLLSKASGALASLNKQFQERKVAKTYLAIVKNKPENDKGTLTHFLQKNEKQNRSVAYDKEIAHSKKAELTYEVIGSSDNYHLLKVELHTGRHHQIRAQLAAIGSPIKGDVKYGFRRSNPDRSIHLHAWKIAFKHPVSGAKEEIVAPLPTDGLWDYFNEKLD
ncbi:MAG: RluA family pseudouridine synthase [Saprospiraceae bacterium]